MLGLIVSFLSPIKANISKEREDKEVGLCRKKEKEEVRHEI
jgi:hypothetical protein